MPTNHPSQPADAAHPRAANRGARQTRAASAETRRWWIKLWLQPLLLFTAGALLFALLGWAQRLGLISAGGSAPAVSAAADANVSYICPMMCTPPQAEPGRCPVCQMELVPATSSSGPTDPHAVHITPAARRLANIETVAVQALSANRAIRTIGQLTYDEGSLKALSAYVDGRIERLFADYTGVVVNQGDKLALVYSPQLYSSQVEYLLAKKNIEASTGGSLPTAGRPDSKLYFSARQRLIELGMTEGQVDRLEQSGQANSRIELVAPIAGTVIDKLAVEGQYVQEGDVIYRLADLSTIWLMLELFPADAAAVRYGQKVAAEVQSLPGRTFSGRVAFIDPQVDPETRTVGVRVVVPNEEGWLRVGDYARAMIDVPLSGGDTPLTYDSELAGMWISPRHPHVVADSPGDCPICGVALVPAEKFGFAPQPLATPAALVLPRDAILAAGQHSVVYVETEPGRFELRPVVLGPATDGQVVVRSGLEEGEQVATRGNFLIDSQMQLAGNPSLIDPTRIVPGSENEEDQEIRAALAQLTESDRALAQAQKFCPVAEIALGSMGTPLAVEVEGRKVFICCEGCREKLLANPSKYLEKVRAASPSPADPDPPPEFGPPGASSPPDFPAVPANDLPLPPDGQPQSPTSAPKPDGQHAVPVASGPRREAPR